MHTSVVRAMAGGLAVVLLVGLSFSGDAQTTEKPVKTKPVPPPKTAVVKPREDAVKPCSQPTTVHSPGHPTDCGTGPIGRHNVPPAAKGNREVRTPGGTVIRIRANGSRSDIHDAERGMDIHHGLNGERRISVQRADGSRIFTERERGYVQQRYMFRGREFGHRTYWDHGRYYDRFYRRYNYRGVYVEVYAPTVYWAPGFYGWAYNPWGSPVAYAWGWGPAPWYGYYGAYFAPYPMYPGAAFWLTDYLIAASLQAAYVEEVAAAQQAAVLQASDVAAVTPDVKGLIVNEVRTELALENQEAGQNAQGQEIDAGSSGIERLMNPQGFQPHVFVAGSGLDLVDVAGQECAVSQGDVLEVMAPPPPDATAATAVVLAAKGGIECSRSDTVTVAFSDLQDMQNYLREQIDQGLGDLKAKQGQDGLPTAPPSTAAPPAQAAFAPLAPPPDPNAGAEISQQAQAADQAEKEAASAAPGVAPPAPATGPATTVDLMGQSVDQVTASLGSPIQKLTLGMKTIYVYKDVKVIFEDGKVSDIQ
jgi:hypothetical protein